MEGVSGVGKSTCSRALRDALRERGQSVVLLDDLLATDEVALAIRSITHDVTDRYAVPAVEELLLYSARLARKASIVRRLHADKPGMVVVADRYSVSVLAYSVHVRGVAAPAALAVVALAARGVAADLTVLLVADKDSSKARRGGKLTRKTRFIADRNDDYERSFITLVESEQLPHIIVDTTSREPQAVACDILQQLQIMEVL